MPKADFGAFKMPDEPYVPPSVEGLHTHIERNADTGVTREWHTDGPEADKVVGSESITFTATGILKKGWPLHPK